MTVDSLTIMHHNVVEEYSYKTVLTATVPTQHFHMYTLKITMPESTVVLSTGTKVLKMGMLNMQYL